MSKAICILLSIVTLSILTVGCKNHTETDGAAWGEGVVYSNIADRESKEVLENALKYAGISQVSIDNLFESINKYNVAVRDALPAVKGFRVFTDNTNYSYNSSKLDTEWKRAYKALSGRKNCRITAFEAMGSLIICNSAFGETEPMMLVEKEELSSFMTTADSEKFSVLFNGIDSIEDIDAKLQAERIAEYWSQCGVDFSNCDKIGLVSIWFNNQDLYNDDNRTVLHCAHAAVLIHTASEEALILEKLDYSLPYQLIKFPTERMALKYIVDFNCVETDNAMALPVVMINDKPLITENNFFIY